MSNVKIKLDIIRILNIINTFDMVKPTEETNAREQTRAFHKKYRNQKF